METKWTLRRIGIASAVKIGAIVFFAIGLILGVLWASVFALFSSVIATAVNTPLPAAAPFLLLFIPVLSAVFYCVLGTFVFFLGALLYNLAAGLFGGIELDLGFERRNEYDQYI